MKWRSRTAVAGLLFAVLIIVSSFVSGCSDDETSPTGPTTGSVTINFNHNVNGVALQTGVFDYTNAALNNYSIDVLQYYASNITLHRSGGTTFGINDVHFRCNEDVSTRGYTMSAVPNGTYTAVSFVFGLNGQTNVTGSLPVGTPTDCVSGGGASKDMGWPACWGGGYHYMILEGKYKESGTGTEYGYRTHTGRRMLIEGGALNCDTAGLGGPDLVNHHHFFEVVLTFATPITVGGNSWEADVNMNLNGWYEDPVVNLETLFPQGTGGIMTNLGVQQLLKENGPGCFSVDAPVKL